MSEELTEVLNVLAERFGTTIDHLYGVMIKQAIITGVGWVFVYIAMGYIVYLYIRYVKSRMNDKNLDDLILDDLVVVAGGISLAVVVPLMIIFLPNVIAMIFNPEYWVLQQILGVLN